MATNLRLNEREAEALREAADASGQSQQQLLRAALRSYLHLDDKNTAEQAIADGLVRAPTAFIDVEPRLRLADGLSTLDLLDRDDR